MPNLADSTNYLNYDRLEKEVSEPGRRGILMSDTKDLRQIANNMVKSLKKNDEVLAIWFYGAAHRGRTWEESDVDLLVLTESAPVAHESRADRGGIIVHLHWIGREEFERETKPSGDSILHGRVGDGELLYDRDEQFGPLMERLDHFADEYRVYHVIPHLNGLLYWARDLRKRMALHDERPRRAAARQWEVDNHSSAVLLIEKGHYPHNEPTTQAMDARIFVPNMADPGDIEGFVRPHFERLVLPQLREWGEEGDFDEGSLRQRYGVGESALLLEWAAREGLLKRVKTNERSGFSIQEFVYRVA